MLAREYADRAPVVMGGAGVRKQMSQEGWMHHSSVPIELLWLWMVQYGEELWADDAKLYEKLVREYPVNLRIAK